MKLHSKPKDLSRLSGTLSEGERDLLPRPPILLFQALAPRVPLPFGEGPRSGGEVSRLQAMAFGVNPAFAAIMSIILGKKRSP